MRISAAEDRIRYINRELEIVMGWMSRFTDVSTDMISKYVDTVSSLLNERTDLIKSCDKSKSFVRFNQTFSLKEAEIFVEELDMRASATSLIPGSSAIRYFDEAKEIRKLSDDIKDKISVIKHSIDI